MRKTNNQNYLNKHSAWTSVHRPREVIDPSLFPILSRNSGYHPRAVTIPVLITIRICRSSPLPVNFCVASQCPHFPCNRNDKTQSLCKTHTGCLAIHVQPSLLFGHSQCPSVTLLESYRACLWCIDGEQVNAPCSCPSGQLLVVTYPDTCSV